MNNMSTRPSPEARVESWVRDYGRLIRGYVLKLVASEELADDLVQEVFQRAWQARARYQEQGTPRAYLLRIADRLVCDHVRRRGRELTLDDRHWQEVEPCQEDGEPSATLSRSEDRQALDMALEVLSSSQKRVLLLRYYGELSFAEIADLMGCPLGTVLSHCRRGLLALRKIMTEDLT
jgi:RNA polymerase sigma-70 factor (ECF subfamily)